MAWCRSWHRYPTAAITDALQEPDLGAVLLAQLNKASQQQQMSAEQPSAAAGAQVEAAAASSLLDLLAAASSTHVGAGQSAVPSQAHRHQQSKGMPGLSMGPPPDLAPRHQAAAGLAPGAHRPGHADWCSSPPSSAPWAGAGWAAQHILSPASSDALTSGLAGLRLGPAHSRVGSPGGPRQHPDFGVTSTSAGGAGSSLGSEGLWGGGLWSVAGGGKSIWSSDGAGGLQQQAEGGHQMAGGPTVSPTQHHHHPRPQQSSSDVFQGQAAGSPAGGTKQAPSLDALKPLWGGNPGGHEQGPQQVNHLQRLLQQQAQGALPQQPAMVADPILPSAGPSGSVSLGKRGGGLPQQWAGLQLPADLLEGNLGLVGSPSQAAKQARAPPQQHQQSLQMLLAQGMAGLQPQGDGGPSGQQQLLNALRQVRQQ